MVQLWESTQVDGQDMTLCMSVPDGTGPFPTVVVVHHMWGIDNFTQVITRRLAIAGYVGVAPDMFHRDGLDCQDDAPTRNQRYSDDHITLDVNGTVDFLLKHQAVDGERLGIIGFCSGGRVTYLMAAVNPIFKAAAAYYATSTMVPMGDGPSPFARTPQIHCPVIGFFGEDDTNPSIGDMHKLDTELTKHGKVHEFYSYSGAGHAFLNQVTERDNRYRHQAAQDAWSRTIAFFDKYVAGGVAPSS